MLQSLQFLKDIVLHKLYDERKHKIKQNLVIVGVLVGLRKFLMAASMGNNSKLCFGHQMLSCNHNELVKVEWLRVNSVLVGWEVLSLPGKLEEVVEVEKNSY